jgi:hypothetical protein
VVLTCPGCDHAEGVPEPEPDQREEGELGQHEEEGQEDVPRQPLPVALHTAPLYNTYYVVHIILITRMPRHNLF